jgi:hypothetical protein
MFASVWRSGCVRATASIRMLSRRYAAKVDAHGAAVLRYDSDYELIAKHTELSFQSIWASSAAALDRPSRDRLCKQASSRPCRGVPVLH